MTAARSGGRAFVAFVAILAAGSLVVILVAATLRQVRARRAHAAGAGAPPPAPPPPEARRSTPAGLTLWVLGDSLKVRPGETLGPPHGRGVPARLQGARGETVAFQLALAAETGSPRVEVGLSDLSGLEGIIPRRSVSAFLETHLYCPPVEDKLVALPPGEYPDPLIPLWENGPGSRPIASPFPLLPRRNQVLWVEVDIPRETRAGGYTGRLTVSAAGQPPTELPLNLQVLPFEIPARPSLAAWVPLYATRLWEREQLASLAGSARLEAFWAYFRMAHAHRFSTQVVEQQPNLRWDEASGALLSVDWAEYDAVYGPALEGALFDDREPPRLWKVGGFVWWGARPGDPPNFGGDYRRDSALTPAHRRALTEYARAAALHFREKGWTRPELFMYMIDEPKFTYYPGTPRLVKDYGDTLHASGAGIRHLVTIAPHESPLPLGAVDIWATWGAGYRPREMRARQALGEKAWFYQQHEPFVGGHCLNNEGLGLRSWAWIAWRYGVDGIFLWVGNFWDQDPYHSVYNWDDGLLGNGILFYPGAMLPSLGFPAVRGPVPSFRMKALRRGLLDYEYFARLRALGGDPDPIVGRVMRSALNEKEYDPYWNHPLWTRPGDWTHDPTDWDAAREEVGREILRRMGR
ncbi:MAG TPA: glycoside hydrolase domain-containing protein [Vicinamibacteria bacterium]|nr:glycoside hydrolase domain-containing protein [Vicinamibacteria bacterium]